MSLARKAPVAAEDDMLPRLVRAVAPRDKSLIVTVYGDAILPQGGGAWLGDLIALVAPLGVAERSVRTSVYRLTREGVLQARPLGRRSHYSLTPMGVRRFEAAAERIYATRDRDWDGVWTQVWIEPGLAERHCKALRRELGWLGFAPLAPAMLVFAGEARDAASTAVADLGLEGRATLLTATADTGNQDAAIGAVRAQVAALWPLDALAVDYQAFMQRFGCVETILAAAPAPETCFALRVLLAHDYRRVVLRDPMLPADLLPPDWPGLAAAAMARDLYRALAGPAQAHVAAMLDGFSGPLPSPGPAFAARFGDRPAA